MASESASPAQLLTQNNNDTIPGNYSKQLCFCRLPWAVGEHSSIRGILECGRLTEDNASFVLRGQGVRVVGDLRDEATVTQSNRTLQSCRRGRFSQHRVLASCA